ncbi:MAG TPA: phage holin family protein [Elusimicrobiota bacterium]|nr:phage holin family protein [Elusimicrobiota bacterium]
MSLIAHLFVNTLAVLTGAYLLRGVHVDKLLTAVVVAIVLGLVNVVIKPLLVLITLPISILSLGLFLFVINAALIMLVAWWVPGFSVDSFWWALAYSLVLTVVSAFLNSLKKMGNRTP